MSPHHREESKVIVCLFVILFIGVADSQILSPLLPAIRSQFGKSSSQTGLLFTCYSLCAGLFVLITGPLSDTFGRKQGLLKGLAIFGTGSFLSCMSSSFSMLMAGRSLTGIGAGILSLNSIAYAADFFPYAKRGWAMGSIFSSYFAALILGVPLGSWLGDRHGWNSVFGAMGAAALILIFSTYLLLPPLEGITPNERSTGIAEYIRRYLSFFKTRRSLSALLCSFFASAGTSGFLAFLGMWLHDSFNISGSRIGFVFLVSGAAALLASPFAGSLADRIGKRFQFVISSVFLALFLFILPNMHWGSFLFCIFGLISLAAAFRQGPMEAVLSEIVSSESRGSFIALKNSCSQLGIGLAAMLSGILFELHGYSAVCILCAVSSLLAATAMSFTGRKWILQSSG
jgi:predicted MFS family arabinose efflux permease